MVRTPPPTSRGRAPEHQNIADRWAREIEQRVAAYKNGELATIPAEEVFAEAKAETGFLDD
ncbi:MAG: hypothetical protein COX57_00110 [Alphaproteobacteria bacterium CG_4_10_14_0_2_um_filter_63_37]|nr:MAG: hypothetical protein AUJ55_00945 [Proteobacteria bacterium CG1_02_64_396]PJA26060.1 MAG: hypothetical protein COX57_00110 [Alphaproteobacteria bacterium CG_4_10_14_0_2_um_filter_63_37]